MISARDVAQFSYKRLYLQAALNQQLKNRDAQNATQRPRRSDRNAEAAALRPRRLDRTTELTLCRRVYDRNAERTIVHVHVIRYTVLV